MGCMVNVLASARRQAEATEEQHPLTAASNDLPTLLNQMQSGAHTNVAITSPSLHSKHCTHRL